MDAIRSSLPTNFLEYRGGSKIGSVVVGEDDLGGGSKIGSAVAGVGVVGTESICTSLKISPSLSALMTQEIDPTVKIWLGSGEDKELEKCTILFVREITAHPYLSRQLSTE